MLEIMNAAEIIQEIERLPEEEKGKVVDFMRHLPNEETLAAMEEAARIATAEGVDLSDFDLAQSLEDLCRATADNRVSMLQDIMAGRPTEIDSICGEVVKRGEALGIPTPRNQTLHALVKGIEQSTRV